MLRKLIKKLFNLKKFKKMNFKKIKKLITFHK